MATTSPEPVRVLLIGPAKPEDEAVVEDEAA